MRPRVDSEDEVSAGVEVRGGAIEVNPDRLRDDAKSLLGQYVWLSLCYQCGIAVAFRLGVEPQPVSSCTLHHRRRVVRLAQSKHMLGDQVAKHLEGAAVDAGERREPVDVFRGAV